MLSPPITEDFVCEGPQCYPPLITEDFVCEGPQCYSPPITEDFVCEGPQCYPPSITEDFVCEGPQCYPPPITLVPKIASLWKLNNSFPSLWGVFNVPYLLQILQRILGVTTLTRFNKICYPSQMPRWQVDKEAIGLSRVQQCSSTYSPPS